MLVLKEILESFVFIVVASGVSKILLFDLTCYFYPKARKTRGFSKYLMVFKTICTNVVDNV